MSWRPQGPTLPPADYVYTTAKVTVTGTDQVAIPADDLPGEILIVPDKDGDTGVRYAFDEVADANHPPIYVGGFFNFSTRQAIHLIKAGAANIDVYITVGRRRVP